MSKISVGIPTLAIKLGSKLVSIGIKFVKVTKVGKIGLAMGSMASYAYLFTWQFAVMVMISLFFHEYGHIFAMKRCGLKMKGIYFIPFFGAAAVSEETFKTRRNEIYIAIMGPIWGLGLSIVTLLGYYVTGNALYAAAAGWMAMVNLFNLLPINPLDGGRIMKSITFSIDSKIGLIFLAIGIIVSGILVIWAKLILFSILLVVACIELAFEYHIYSKDKDIVEFLKEDLELHPDTKEVVLREYEIPPPLTVKGILISGVTYILVIAMLWMLMSEMNHIPEVEIARKFFMG